MMKTVANISGWSSALVGDVSDLLRGISYSKEQSSQAPLEGMSPILRANNISSDLNFDDLVYVERSLISADQLIRKGDILFAMSSGSKKHVGKSAIATQNFNGSFGAFCGLLRVSPSFNAKYLAYFFQSSAFRQHIGDISKGTNINNLKREHILDFEFPVPPINEQKRIVAKIEELFSELDNGIKNLKTAREQLKIYRQAILKYAFEGKLTTEWREKNKDKLETTDELLERINQEHEAYYQHQLREFEDQIKSRNADNGQGVRHKKPKRLNPIVAISSKEALRLPNLPHGWQWASLSWMLSLHKKPMTTGPFGTMLSTGYHKSFPSLTEPTRGDRLGAGGERKCVVPNPVIPLN